MSNWFNNFGFNPIQRPVVPNGGPVGNHPPVNGAPPAFTGSHGVDSFERRSELFPTQPGTVHEIVNNVSNIPVNRESIVGGGHLSSGTFDALSSRSFKFPPIEG